MKCFFIIISLFGGLLQAQCDDLLELQCTANLGCEWIDNIETEFCGAYNQEECLEQQGCWWYPGGWYLGAYCNGSYQVDNSYCIEDSQCQDYQFQCSDGTCICLNSDCLNNADTVICDGVFDCLDGSDEIDCSECSWINESACISDANCNWVENIETGNCNWLSTSECMANPQCFLDCTTTYDCFGCTGGWYEIDNGFCESIEVLECSEMNEFECIAESTCELVEEIIYGNCSYYNNGSTCNVNENCWWDCWSDLYAPCECECISSSCYFPIYTDSYCEEVSFLPGDANGDGSLNVSDIVLMVDLILSLEYDNYSDMNQDGVLNILDIVEIVNIILDN